MLAGALILKLVLVGTVVGDEEPTGVILIDAEGLAVELFE